MELRSHQKLALSKLGNGKILNGDVGSGKTLTAAAYYMHAEAPRDVYVITTAKKRDSLDWEEEFAHFGVGKDVSVPGAGKLHVDSWNNIAKYKEVQDGFFVFDEQRLVGSGAWTKSFIAIAKRNRWILLSATPGDTWLDYVPVFIANGFYKNRTEFKRRHVVYSPYSKFPKVERYLEVGHLVKLKNSILVDMPFDRHTVRHLIRKAVEYDLNKYQRVVKDRWNPYTEKPIKNSSELFSAMRKVVNSDPSRLSVVRTLLETHPRLIVFYNFDYELAALREMVYCMSNATSAQSHSSTTPSTDSTRKTSGTRSSSRTSELDSGTSTGSLSRRSRSSDAADAPTHDASTGTFAVGEWNGHRHDPIPTTDRWVYLVQYVAGAEGWNCTTTDSMLLYSLTYSYKNYHQALGRIDRLDTPFTDLNYYVLKSNAPIDNAVWKALSTKKSFNERKYAPKF